jgi:dicarboxylate/amino acid:cation (Na+ or H+) symporter, DAACS family
VSHKRMLLGIAVGLVLGLVVKLVGGDDPWVKDAVYYVEPVGKIFLRLLFMLVIPLLFAALVTGVCELELGKVGRLGARMFAYTIVVSLIAVLIGLFLVNVLQPGGGDTAVLREKAKTRETVKAAAAPSDTSTIGLIVAIVPKNVVQAAATDDMIGVIAFALIFGLGLSATKTAAALRLRETIQGLHDVTTTLVNGVLAFAPIGVGALIFAMIATLGVDVLIPLGKYVGVVVLGLAIHFFVVYSLSVRFFGGRNPVRFFLDVKLAILTAFATASSSATLPTALKVAEEELKLPRHVARFVLTAGSAMNQNGTALFEGVTVLFLAQLYGIPLDIQKQGTIMVICVLAGIGTAGVPAGSIPVIAMILGMYGIPVEGLGLILLGVDRFLDMCRTTLNVVGDLAAAVYVARGVPADAVPPSGDPSGDISGKSESPGFHPGSLTVDPKGI